MLGFISSRSGLGQIGGIWLKAGTSCVDSWGRFEYDSDEPGIKLVSIKRRWRWFALVCVSVCSRRSV